MKEYYDRRTPEYDDWYLGRGRWQGQVRPGWADELLALHAVLSSLPPATTLDVACGTGFLSRWLPGPLTCLDQSARMLEVAAARLPDASFVCADALDLPFAEGAFERVFTGHFYGHLQDEELVRFVEEARRVASELVVVDASRLHANTDAEWQHRVLNDGSRWQVYKRYFTPDGLLVELGGGGILHAGRWFVAVRSP